MPVDDPMELVVGAILPSCERIQFRLRHNQFFVRPAHRDELADERHLQLTVHFFRFITIRMLVEPARKSINERQVSIHVFVLDERATHDDLWNEH